MSSPIWFADAEKLKIKSGLLSDREGRASPWLSQEEAGQRMGLSQPKVSGLFRGDFTNVSERKLMNA